MCGAPSVKEHKTSEKDPRKCAHTGNDTRFSLISAQEGKALSILKRQIKREMKERAR
jgi:hypothetical protein